MLFTIFKFGENRLKMKLIFLEENKSNNKRKFYNKDLHKDAVIRN